MRPPRLTDDQMMGGGMSDDEFAAWFVADIMKDDLPDYYTDLGPDTCAEFTITARRYARHFGITRPDLQAQFAYLMWTVGPNFWSFGAFNRILTARWPREEDKIEALFNVSTEDAEEAILGADDTHWYPQFVENNILGVPFESDDDG
jgi:hypothetical protein